MSKPPTIEEAFADATARLKTSDTPQLDASLLLSHALDCPRSFLMSHPETALTPEQQTRFASVLERRIKGEPIAYITGIKEFWSLELAVTPDVLVPRPETETLVEAALARIPADRACRVADIGTGSGAIALAIARERPQAHVVGIDVSDAALAVARRNERALRIPNVVFHESLWFAALVGQRFDVIVSNPPYVRVGDPHLASLRFEPASALIAGSDGLDGLRALVSGAPAHLEKGGWLLFEHGADQGEAAQSLLQAAGFFEISTIPDFAGLPRVTAGHL